MRSKTFYYIIPVIIFCAVLVYINYAFGVKQIEVQFLDGNIDREIITTIEKEIHENANTFTNILFLDKELLTKLVRDEHESIKSVDFNNKFFFENYQNFGMKLDVTVSINDEYLVACVQESEKENFLVSAMLGNSLGELFQEVPEEYCENKNKTNLLRITLSSKSIFNKFTEEKVDSPDSLSGTRIYSGKDFIVLKELINYLKKNEFSIENIFAGELKIVEIDLGKYVLKVNLDKDPKETIFDFETISRVGKLQKYVNEQQDSLQYVDLTFKDKVFFKLKNNTETDIIQVISTSSNI